MSARYTLGRSPPLCMKTPRQPLDRRGRRLIGDEVARELGGDEMRGGRLVRQIAQHRDTLRRNLRRRSACPAPLWRPARAPRRGTGICPAAPPAKRPPAPPIDQPVITWAKVVTSRLRVAAAHPEGVQLENLAREVLVDADLARRPAALRAAAPAANAAPPTGGCRGTAASPDASRRRAAGRRSCRARAGGSPRARSCPASAGKELLVDRHREVVASRSA